MRFRRASATATISTSPDAGPPLFRNRRRARRAGRRSSHPEIAMMTRDALRAALAHMEEALAKTRRNIAGIERRMRDHAEAETIRRRPTARYYHRRMSRWTGADEAEYQRILEALAGITFVELSRLDRKAERQDRAIEALRQKYGVNAPRPRIVIARRRFPGTF